MKTKMYVEIYGYPFDCTYLLSFEKEIMQNVNIYKLYIWQAKKNMVISLWILGVILKQPPTLHWWKIARWKAAEFQPNKLSRDEAMFQQTQTSDTLGGFLRAQSPC